MLIIKRLFITFSLIFVQAKDFDVVAKLDSKQIIDSLTSETFLKYLNELAQIFAKKAAESFIEEIKNKKHLLKYKEKTSSPSLINASRSKPKKVKQILNEEEALKLLEDPSPDGDNLESHSDVDSEFENNVNVKKAIPVYGLTKVNGVYVRRLLGHLS
ncbi:unnamed protein product, partial [Brenthis ino]